MMDNLREQEEQHEAQEMDSFNGLSELEEKFCLNNVPVDVIIKKENYFLFLSTKSEEKPEIKYAMKLSENLTYELHCDGLPLKHKQIDDIKDLHEKLSSFSLLVNVLVALEKMYEGKFWENIEEEELIEEVIKLLKNSRLYDNKRIAFLTEQLMLAVLSPRQRRVSSLLAMSVMRFKISPTAYKHVYQEGILTLPTERRIQQLTSAVDVDLKLGDSTKAYLKARISKLHLKDLSVALLVDEVYSSKQVQYSHGRFYGNENGEITETLLCFMIKSVAGKYRDVVAMIPISNLTADKQYTAWYNTASALTEIGFDIGLTMMDGNNVNHTFFSKICGNMRKALKTSIDSPFSGSKMFVGFDPIHLFKCFYTNFMTKKFFKCPSYAEGNEELRASFAHLKQLYNIEFGKSVRMTYKLSDKTLNPKSIERSNVALADSCFHESTINALNYYSDHGHDDFAETAAVLQIFRTWFNALNVKSLYTGLRTKDVNRNPVTKEDRSVLEVFHQFGKWLDRLKASGNIGLSTQTFKAAILTTQMLIDLCNYLLDVKGLDYILLGHTSSDYLESRFGWYRQSSGANYYISVLQILQSEKSIRIKSLIESGFQMSDLKNIFAATDNSTMSDSLTDELTALSQLIPEYSLSESLVVAPED